MWWMDVVARTHFAYTDTHNYTTGTHCHQRAPMHTHKIFPYIPPLHINTHKHVVRDTSACHLSAIYSNFVAGNYIKTTLCMHTRVYTCIYTAVTWKWFLQLSLLWLTLVCISVYYFISICSPFPSFDFNLISIHLFFLLNPDFSAPLLQILVYEHKVQAQSGLQDLRRPLVARVSAGVQITGLSGITSSHCTHMQYIWKQAGNSLHTNALACIWFHAA